MHHHRSAGLEARGGDEGQDAGDVPGEPVLLHGALQEGGSHARVVDSVLELAHEKLDDRVVRPVGEEPR